MSYSRPGDRSSPADSICPATCEPPLAGLQPLKCTYAGVLDREQASLRNHCDGLDIFGVLREPLRVRRERQVGLNRHYLPEMVKHLEDTAPKGADLTRSVTA